MKKRSIPTLEEVGKIIRRVNLARLENRLVGKPLVELEHCLIEVLGYLQDSHRMFNESTASLAKICIEAESQTEFLSCWRDYRQEKTTFGGDFNIGSPVGEYFYALRERLSEREDKQIDGTADLGMDGIVPLTHARILAVLICAQIDRMWASSQYINEKVENLWSHWMNSK